MLAVTTEGFTFSDIGAKDTACSTIQTPIAVRYTFLCAATSQLCKSDAPQITTTIDRDVSSRESTQPQRKCQSNSYKTALLDLLVLLATIFCCSDAITFGVKSISKILLSFAASLVGRMSSSTHSNHVVSIRPSSSTSRLLMTFLFLTSNILDGSHQSPHVSDMIGSDGLNSLHRASVTEAVNTMILDMDRNQSALKSTGSFLSERTDIDAGKECPHSSPSHPLQSTAFNSEITCSRQNHDTTSQLLNIPNMETYVTAAPTPTPLPLTIPPSSSYSVSRSAVDSEIRQDLKISSNRPIKRAYYPTPSPLY